ncbi:MAG: protein kinase [Myxococcales bacterium]|nr:protein kinase [Myxococcales bacterium]
MERRCPRCDRRLSPAELRCPVDGTYVQPTGPAADQAIGGRYRLTTLLGIGGMGVVYGADDLRSGRGVALKMLDTRWADDRTVRERFLREIRTGMGLQHPHIARVFDAGHGPEGTWLVMERLEGQSLAARLERGPLSLTDALEVARQVCEALAVVHPHGVVHRDIKPGNVFLVRGPRAIDVRVLDFGLALLVDETPLTQAGAVLGTPRYMAPEQVRKAPTTGQADLYALGVLLFEALGGGPLYEGDDQRVMIQQALAPTPTLRSRGVKVPELIEQFVLALLAKDPAQRPQGAMATATRIFTLQAQFRAPALAATVPPVTPVRVPAVTEALDLDATVVAPSQHTPMAPEALVEAWLSADAALVEARGELREALERWQSEQKNRAEKIERLETWRAQAEAWLEHQPDASQAGAYRAQIEGVVLELARLGGEAPEARWGELGRAVREALGAFERATEAVIRQTSRADKG